MSEWKRNKKRTNGIPRGMSYGMTIEARQRDGTIFAGVVGKHKWLQDMHFNTSDNCESDVMAYRILEQNEPATQDYTNGYPEGTTAADIGAKVGDEFVVVAEKYGHYFEIGDVVTLDKIKENGTYQFSKDDVSSHLLFDELAPLSPKSAIEPQAEEVGIPEPVKMAEDEGWIEWNGGECPVSKGVKADLKFRNGDTIIEDDYAYAFRWSHVPNYPNQYDIVAYRTRHQQEWPEDRIDVVGQNGNDGLHYDDVHLGIKRPDGEGFVKYNAGDVIDLDGVVSIDWISGGWPDEVITAHPPEYLDFAPHEPRQVAWYRLNYAEQIDTSPERVEIEQESARIPTEERIEKLHDHADSALKAFERGVVDVSFDSDKSLVHYDVYVKEGTPTSAPGFLHSALQTLTQRGKDYDKPEGERSAAAVAVAFNAITGRNLTEAEVWLVLQLVKDVRQWKNPGRYHADSALDCVAYAALKAEALAKGGE